MKSTIIGILIITAIFGILLFSIKRDEKINKYWNEQFDICGRAGYYHDTESNECVPVEYIKNL